MGGYSVGILIANTERTGGLFTLSTVELGMSGIAVPVDATIAGEGFRGMINYDGTVVRAPERAPDWVSTSEKYRGLDDTSAIPDSAMRDGIAPNPSSDWTLALDPTPQTFGLESGDWVFLYAELDHTGREPDLFYINPKWGHYIIGAVQICLEPELGTSPSWETENPRSPACSRRVWVQGDPKTSEWLTEAIPLSTPTNPYTTNDLVSRLALGDEPKRLSNGEILRFDDAGVENIHAFYHDEVEVSSPMVDYVEGEQYRKFLLFNGADEHFVIDGGFVDQLYYWFEENPDVDLKSEQALLCTFVYLVCGRHPDLCDITKEHCETLEDAYQNQEFYDEIDDRTRNKLNDLDEWPHAHAAMHLTGSNAAEFVEQAVESYYEDLNTSIIDHVEGELYNTAHDTELDQFDWEMQEMMDKVSWMGRLCAFDWNECLIRVHGYEWQAPKRCKRFYIDTAAPKPGFARVFGDDMDDLSQEQVNARLDDMDHYLQEHLHMSTTESVFVIESCLCNYVKLPNEVYQTEERGLGQFL